MRERWTRTIATLAIALILSPTPELRAQGAFGHLEDASIVPRGLFRLRTAGVWTRYDQRYSTSGTVALGAPFTSDAFGSAQIPELSIADSLVDDAAAASFTMSLGKSRLNAVAREEYVPFTLEYGWSRRLSFSAVVPLVRKRVHGLLTLDTAGSNMGPNPRRLGGAATTTNALVQQEFLSARNQLQSQLASCTSNPAGAGCAALLARQAEAQALIQSAQTFASSVAGLYGTTTTNGEAFVPRSSSAAQAAIAARIAAFNAQYQDILASSATFVSAIPVGASGPAGTADLEAYVNNDLARDSIANKQLVGIGDMEFGFKYLAVDRAGFMVAVASSVRIPTGSRQAPIGVADLRIGDGGLGFDARAIVDLHRGRMGLLGATSFSKVGASEVLAGTVDSRRITIDLAPRWHLSAPLAIHGAYSLRNADVTGSAHVVGGGVTFTTVDSWTAGTRPLPMEMRFTHLESARGDAGAPKFTRDQLEVRIYYQARGR